MLDLELRRRLGPFELELSLATEDHGTVVLFGHSGSGKSVTLAMVAGLLRPDAGRIVVAGRTLFDDARGLDLPPQRRNLGYVVQQLALFPHLTAAENIAYGLERQAPEARRRRVADLVALLDLGGLERRLPRQLSGGQQQRVALARAMARPVDALLLDEPFSALDEALRAELRGELVRLRHEMGVPILFVTHDLREAHLLGDRIAVLDRGRLLQFADRETVFRRPASRRVAELTGTTNIFRGTSDGASVRVEGVTFRLEGLDGPTPEGDVDVAIRAERCNLRRLDPDSLELPPNAFAARIVQDLAFGNTHTLRLAPEGPGPAVEVEVASRPYEVLGVASRARWVVELPPADLHVMPRTPGDGATSSLARPRR